MTFGIINEIKMMIYYQTFTITPKEFVGDRKMKMINISSMMTVVIILLLLSSGCRTIAGQPSIKTAEIIPEEISPGDTAIIQAVIKDKHHLIQKVEAVIKEDPRIKLKLRDDGVEPDKKANDGIWVLKVDVPSEAPSGNYKLEVMTYTKDGSPVKIKSKNGEIENLATEIPVIIKK